MKIVKHKNKFRVVEPQGLFKADKVLSVHANEATAKRWIEHYDKLSK